MRVDAQVAADRGDDVGDRHGVDVVVEVERVQPLVELGVQRLGLGFAAVRLAVDGVLDVADDLLAGGHAALLGLLGGARGGAGLGGVGELAGKGDGAADGARDAVEGDGELGCCDLGCCRWCCGWGWGGLGGLLGCGGGLRVGLWGGLTVDGAGEAAADLDQLVQDLAVILGVLVALGSAVGRLRMGGRGGRRGG